MYTLRDEQVDFILSDIKARGVEMEDLQNNLLDHICCMIENELEREEDFELFYEKVIARFFKRELKEIEEETIYLLTFKNYYAMKKSMIVTGIFSAAALIFGSIFKVMHWPGAGVLFVLGIGVLSLIFLPLMFILKTKDNSSKREKLILAIGAVIGILLCMAVLFTVMHWPNGNGMFWFAAIGVSVFVLIPVYFFTGIRNPDSKLNTVVTTIVLIGASGLLFAMVNVRPAAKQLEMKMYSYVNNEKLLEKMQQTASDSNLLTAEINKNCEELKKLILIAGLDTNSIPADFESRHILLEEGNLGPAFREDGRGRVLLSELNAKITNYNLTQDEKNKIPLSRTILVAGIDKIDRYSNYTVLNGLVQIQMFLN
jgi:hypothetical protein